MTNAKQNQKMLAIFACVIFVVTVLNFGSIHFHTENRDRAMVAIFGPSIGVFVGAKNLDLPGRKQIFIGVALMALIASIFVVCTYLCALIKIG